MCVTCLQLLNTKSAANNDHYSTLNLTHICNLTDNMIAEDLFSALEEYYDLPLDNTQHITSTCLAAIYLV